MTTVADILAEFIEHAETCEARANTSRGVVEKSRQASVRHYHNGIANMAEDAAKAARAIVVRHTVKKPVLQLVREAADV